jgi:Protein of unknown function (DUF3305)
MWAEFLWRPVSVLVGQPLVEPWTVLNDSGDVTLFYAGSAVLELHRTETSSYRDNLAAPAPHLWVALRPTISDPPYELLAVTADPAEGEGFSDAGNNLVEPVPMPSSVADVVSQFVVQHHVDRPFVKRERDRYKRSRG